MTLCCLPLLASAQFSGKVYVDKNLNGCFDAGEKLLKQVIVSDGLNVVSTDAKGFFELPGHAKEKFIFITTPSGYKTNNTYYQRIDKNQDSYDFGVIPYKALTQKDGTHKFVQISDTEIGSSAEHDDWVQNVRDYVSNEGASFVVHTGDICYTAGLNAHIELMNTANMNTQMFYCIGNHDLVKGEYGEKVFEAKYGPTFYSFEVGNVHYIVTPMLGGDYSPSYTKRDVYEWLKNDLKFVSKEKAIMVFNHDLLTSKDEFIYKLNDTERIDLDAHNLKAWIYGHWHINHVRKHKSAYSICTSTMVRGGIDHASAGFRVYDVDAKGDFSTELRYSYLDKSVEIASLDNLESAVLPNGAVPLSVNAYSTTTPTKSVNYLCKYDGKPIVKGKAMQQTDFNWYAEMELPASYDGKFVTVCVDVTFNNGELAKTEHSFVYHSKPDLKIEAGSDWTNLLGNVQHVGISKDTIAPILSLAWVNNVGSNIYMTSPVVYNNKIFVASLDEDNKGLAAVISMDAETGKRLWKYAVKGSIKNSIALTAGIVFAQDVHGNLYAIDAETGKLRWEKKMNWPAVPALNVGLIADNGIVYAGSGPALCAIEAETSKMLWENNQWGTGEGCTVTLSLNNNVLMGGAHWGALYANDAKTGKLLWGNGSDGLRNRSASPAMLGDVLYLISKSSFFIIEAKSGQVLIRKELGYNVDVTSTPLVTNSEIIFGTAQKGVVALDRLTLEPKWEFMTSPALVYSSPYTRNPSATVETSPVLSGKTVYVTASDGHVYALDKSTGVLQWKHSFGAPVFSSPAIAGNALFISDFSGNVYGFTQNEVKE